MSSGGGNANGGGKKEEERNEKVVRGLLKLPPNRRCINCNSPGPQYVCTNFWTFVCVSCSGIHREFTHRVKSVSMSKFSTQEVEALQRGGNQRAREMFLKVWDAEQMRYPAPSNIDSLREFIKDVYIVQKYAGERCLDKPPRDLLHKAPEEYRRASSYHSFSQSPPYDYQYEEHLHGKKNGILSRKPGSDGGYYDGKITSSVSSPGSQYGEIHEDRLACGNYGSRKSDYSGFILGGPRIVNSPSPQRATNAVDREVKSKEFHAHFERTASSSSIGSFESKSIQSASSSSLADLLGETEHNHAAKPNANSVCQEFKVVSAPTDTLNKNLPTSRLLQQQQQTVSNSALNLFADVEHLSSQKPYPEIISAHPSVFENFGWATFEAPLVKSSSETIEPASSCSKEIPKSTDLFSAVQKDLTDISAFSNSATLVDNYNIGHRIEISSGMISQPWKAFAESVDTNPCAVPPNASMADFFPQETHASEYGNMQIWHSFDAIDGSSSIDSVELVPHSLKEQSTQTHQTTGNPFDSFIEGEYPEVQNPTNPFDVPFGAEEDSISVPSLPFLDVSSLQEALPLPEMPVHLMGCLPEAWFPESETTCLPSIPNGFLPCEQISTSQLPMRVPLSANPFAQT